MNDKPNTNGTWDLLQNQGVCSYYHVDSRLLSYTYDIAGKLGYSTQPQLKIERHIPYMDNEVSYEEAFYGDRGPKPAPVENWIKVNTDSGTPEVRITRKFLELTLPQQQALIANQLVLNGPKKPRFIEEADRITVNLTDTPRSLCEALHYTQAPNAPNRMWAIAEAATHQKMQP